MAAKRVYSVRAGLSVEEIISELERQDTDNNFESIIYAIPPEETGNDTDEDSDKSDDENEGEMNHLGWRLLNSACEVQVATSADLEEEDSLIPPPTKRTRTERRWFKKDLESDLQTVCTPVGSSVEATKCETPIDFFSLFFNEELLDHILHETNLYAKTQKNINLEMTKDELFVIIGGLLLSGYGKYPNKRMYWSKEEDVPHILAKSMRCNRFETILRHIHLNDNSKIDKNDRLFKLRPFLQKLNESFRYHGGVDENICVDESMIPYYGNHYAKQFIRGKPIRFGFKNWALCSSDGYMMNFQIYTGKGNNEKVFGVGGDVVVSLLNDGNIPTKAGHKVFFDNYFTSLDLMSYLRSIGICATGTIRADRTQKCPLVHVTEMRKRKKRGDYDYRVSDDGVMLIRWNDNNVVTMATNFQELSIQPVDCWSREKKGLINISQPSVVMAYNLNMGGVDKMDQLVAAYRSRMRIKKWWWPIFAYFLDVTIVNSWLLAKRLKNCSHSDCLLNFRRYVAITLLKKHGIDSNKGRVFPKPLTSIRNDCTNHWIVENEKNTQRRCAHCKGKTVYVCEKCSVGLHPKCFKIYHT